MSAVKNVYGYEDAALAVKSSPDKPLHSTPATSAECAVCEALLRVPNTAAHFDMELRAHVWSILLAPCSIKIAFQKAVTFNDSRTFCRKVVGWTWLRCPSCRLNRIVSQFKGPTGRHSRRTGRSSRLTERPSRLTERPSLPSGRPSQLTEQSLRLTERLSQPTDGPSRLTERPRRLTQRAIRLT